MPTAKKIKAEIKPLYFSNLEAIKLPKLIVIKERIKVTIPIITKVIIASFIP